MTLSILFALFYFFYSSYAPRYLHSFPTLRSSDLLYHLVRRVNLGVQQHLAGQLDLEVLDLPGAHKRADRFACRQDRKSTRLNSSHITISYAVFCLKKKTRDLITQR